MSDEKAAGNKQGSEEKDICEPEEEDQALVQDDEQKKDEEFEQDENVQGIKDDTRQEFYYENF